MVYKVPPVRTWSDSEKEWEHIYGVSIRNGKKSSNKTNQMWKKVNRYVMALNDVYLYVVWRNEAIAVDVLTPNVLRIIPEPLDPTKPHTIMIKIAVDVTATSELGADHYYIVWTPDEHYLLTNQGGAWIPVPVEGNEKMINPYGVLPFVGIHKSQNETMWNETGGDDLYQLGLSTSAMQSIWLYNWTWHNFKQMYISTNKELSQGLGRAPDKVIAVPEDSEVGILDWSINTKELQEDIMNRAALIAANYGVDLRQMLGLIEESGRRLQLKQAKLIENRENQLQIFEDAELDTAEIIRVVYEKNTGKKLSGAMEIMFPEIEVHQTPMEKLKTQEKKTFMGLESIIDVHLKENPTFSRDESKAKVKQNIEENNEINGMKDESINDELNAGGDVE